MFLKDSNKKIGIISNVVDDKDESLIGFEIKALLIQRNFGISMGFILEE